MKTLLIMRHAKSSWGEDGLSDHERPLNHRGQRDAPRMGRFLASVGLHAEAVLTSSALRARTTAIATVEAADWDVSVNAEDSLYLAAPQELRKLLKALPDKANCALVVGHNPGVAELVSALTGESVAMPTAAVAEVQIDTEHWRGLKLDQQHTLKNHWYPKGLPAEFT